MTACELYYNKFYFPLLSAKKVVHGCHVFIALIFCNMETFFVILQILISRPFVEGLLGEFL